MRLAQQLYEGVDIKGSGTVGLITYLRTDSTRVSEEAEAAAAEAISVTNFGARLCGGKCWCEKEYCEDPGRARGYPSDRYDTVLRLW